MATASAAGRAAGATARPRRIGGRRAPRLARRAVRGRVVARAAARVRAVAVSRVWLAEPLPAARRRRRPRVLAARVRLRARRAEPVPARRARTAVGSGCPARLRCRPVHTLRRHAAGTRSSLRRMKERGVAGASRHVRRRAAGEPRSSASSRQWNGTADHSSRRELRRRGPHDAGNSPVLEVMHRKPSHAIGDTCVLIGISDVYAGNIHGTVDVSGGTVESPAPPRVEDFIRRQRHPAYVAETKTNTETNSTAEAEEADQCR